MSKLGRYDVTLMTYLCQKYNKKFSKFDDYIELLWDISHKKYGKGEDYVYDLETDIRGFVEWQQEKMKSW